MKGALLLRKKIDLTKIGIFVAHKRIYSFDQILDSSYS